MISVGAYALDLGLGLVFSEDCIPLTTRCLRASLLYIGGATTVYQRKQGPRRFGRKLDSEDGGEWSGRGLLEGTPETHLSMGKAWLSMKLPNWELGPWERLQRGLGGSLSVSRYLSKNTVVVDGSLHLYLIFTFYIYIVT